MDQAKEGGDNAVSATAEIEQDGSPWHEGDNENGTDQLVCALSWIVFSFRRQTQNLAVSLFVSNKEKLENHPNVSHSIVGNLIPFQMKQLLAMKFMFF